MNYDQLIALICDADAPMKDRVDAQYHLQTPPPMQESLIGRIVIGLFYFSAVAFVYAAMLYSLSS